MDEHEKSRILARTQHKSIDRIMASVYKTEERFGNYANISKINRWFHKSLGRAEDRINLNVNKYIV
jgi:hypothetical protein